MLALSSKYLLQWWMKSHLDLLVNNGGEGIGKLTEWQQWKIHSISPTSLNLDSLLCLIHKFIGIQFYFVWANAETKQRSKQLQSLLAVWLEYWIQNIW